MLTLIFGVWINLTQVAYLHPVGDYPQDSSLGFCAIELIGQDINDDQGIRVDHTCDQVAAEINKAKGD